MTIHKTYKLFIGGKFPRSESGRVMETRDAAGRLIANLAQASRKDFRESVVAARKASVSWAEASAYLRGQILYRIAEMLDGRSSQFVSELTAQGVSEKKARTEVEESIDLLVHYAGWTDKYQALFSSVNPVASSHVNFSVPEPVGVVGVIAPESGGLLGLVSTIAPIIGGGNTMIALAGEGGGCAISFAEVLTSSDVPAGVVNILTGKREELVPEFAKHMDVNALLLCSNQQEERRLVDLESAENLKRVSLQPDAPLSRDPYHILNFQEIKTIWHPVGI